MTTTRTGNGEKPPKRIPMRSAARKSHRTAPPSGGGDGLEVTPVYAVWSALRPLLILATSVLLTLGILYSAWKLVDSHFLAPPDPTNEAMVEFTIAPGSSVSRVASQLFGDPEDENRVQFIMSKMVFTYAFEFLGQSHQIKTGTYQLSPSMSITEIIDIITLGTPAQQTMRIRLIEGMTVEEMADELVAQKALESTTEFLALCKSGEAFREEFDFIDELLSSANLSSRRYALEGYLFPDTYEIYIDSSPEVIIRKMLRRADEIFSVNAYELAEAQEVSMDWVLNMASLIEKEAKSADFARVSAVFHNRLAQNIALQSDVTIKYALRTKRMALGAEDLAIKSPYNSYTQKGLPPSPVANPGLAAMLAALTPDEDFVREGFLYFTSTDPESGVLAFSKTLKEHNALADQYRPLWEAYDAKMAAQETPSPTPSPPSATPSLSPTPGGT